MCTYFFYTLYRYLWTRNYYYTILSVILIFSFADRPLQRMSINTRKMGYISKTRMHMLCFFYTTPSIYIFLVVVILREHMNRVCFNASSGCSEFFCRRSGLGLKVNVMERTTLVICDKLISGVVSLLQGDLKVSVVLLGYLCSSVVFVSINFVAYI